MELEAAKAAGGGGGDTAALKKRLAAVEEELSDLKDENEFLNGEVSRLSGMD